MAYRDHMRVRGCIISSKRLIIAKMEFANDPLANIGSPSRSPGSSTLCMLEPVYKLDPDGDILLVVAHSSSMTMHSDYDPQGEKGNTYRVQCVWIPHSLHNI